MIVKEDIISGSLLSKGITMIGELSSPTSEYTVDYKCLLLVEYLKTSQELLNGFKRHKASANCYRSLNPV